MFYELAFVLAIIAIVVIGRVMKTAIRAKHGYPLDERGGAQTRLTDVESDRKIALLSQENEGLTGKVLRLEERVAVLERIVTDRSTQLAEEIEALRHPQAN